MCLLVCQGYCKKYSKWDGEEEKVTASQFWKAEAENQLGPGLVPSEAVRETLVPGFWYLRCSSITSFSAFIFTWRGVCVCVQVFPFNKDTYN